MSGASKGQLTKLRRQIGYIFQAHNLMSFLTAKENVRMSLELHENYFKGDINAKAIAMLEHVGLGEHINRTYATVTPKICCRVRQTA